MVNSIGVIYRLQDNTSGWIVMVENTNAAKAISIEVEIQGQNLHCSRQGAVVTRDVVRPLHFQLIRVHTAIAGSGTFSMQLKMSYKPIDLGAAAGMEQHMPAVAPGGVHCPVRLSH